MTAENSIDCDIDALARAFEIVKTDDRGHEMQGGLNLAYAWQQDAGNWQWEVEAMFLDQHRNVCFYRDTLEEVLSELRKLTDV